MSEERKSFLKALFKFQGLVKNPIKDRQNPHFRSDYVTLDGLLEVVKPALTECELILMQTFEESDGDRYLVTQLCHIDGEYAESKLKLMPEKNTNQGLGSAITYMRRYSIEAICGITGTNDDDGNKSSATGNPQASGGPRTVGVPSDKQKGFYKKLLISKYGRQPVPADVVATAKNMDSVNMSEAIKTLKTELGMD